MFDCYIHCNFSLLPAQLYVQLIFVICVGPIVANYTKYIKRFSWLINKSSVRQTKKIRVTVLLIFTNVQIYYVLLIRVANKS